MKKYTVRVQFVDGKTKEYDTDEKVTFENDVIMKIEGLHINTLNVDVYYIIENIKTV